MKLTNNTILITGGSSGIGLALAKAFIRAGNTVIICGRNARRLEKAKIRLPQLHTFQCDISDPAQQHKLVMHIQDNHPELNVLINNAGIQQYLDFSSCDFPVEKIKAELNINLYAQLEVTYQLLPLLINQPRASMIFLGSALATVPKKSTPVYCASKAAIHNFVKTLRYQLEDTSTEVIEIIPDLVDTAMTVDNKKQKMPVEKLVEQVSSGLRKNKQVIEVGRTNFLFALHRLFPQLAYKILKNG